MLAAALVLTIAVTAQPPVQFPKEPPRKPEMNCRLPFGDLVTQIAAEPGIKHSAPTADNIFEDYLNSASSTRYLVTVPGVPGHPAVVRLVYVQAPAGTMIQPSLCTYGTEAGARELMDIIAANLSRTGGIPMPDKGR